jgi:D-alanyl-lipoteichoic acid acyltransferase DltB (MBOAT superfamily)
MNFSLLSPKFLLLAVVSVVLLTLLRGNIRQLAFLSLNAAFIWVLVLPPTGFASTLAFCLLGYGLVRLHLWRTDLRLVYTLPVFVGLFLYMRNYEILHWILPEALLTSVLGTIGLSFLLFKIIHVLVDAKGGAIEKVDFLTYINYCLNFTTFVMGPIQRYQDYHEQWNGEKQAIDLSYEAHLDAVLRILFGMIKVYILAQWFYAIALKPDTSVLELSFTGFVVMLYGFFFYLYLNFSGYCDVVIGIGSLFGVRPPENFNMPFIAQNISDFWLRQHRSLTLWLTDYVFSPAFKGALGSRLLSRHHVLAGNMALMLTMFVSGVWHGTTIGFLVFGIVHGLYVVIYHTWDHLLTRRVGKKQAKQIRRHWLARLVGIFLTFNATSFAFLFFQLDTPHLLAMLKGMVTG